MKPLALFRSVLLLAFIVVKFRVARSDGSKEKCWFESESTFLLIRWKIRYSASIFSFFFSNVADFCLANAIYIHRIIRLRFSDNAIVTMKWWRRYFFSIFQVVTRPWVVSISSSMPKSAKSTRCSARNVTQCLQTRKSCGCTSSECITKSSVRNATRLLWLECFKGTWKPCMCRKTTSNTSVTFAPIRLMPKSTCMSIRGPCIQEIILTMHIISRINLGSI